MRVFTISENFLLTTPRNPCHPLSDIMRQRFTLDLPDELREKLAELATAQERSLGGQIRHILNRAVDMPDEEEKMDRTPELPGLK